ncbi:MAG: response regulator [Planctomycetes bacterium]|nr:response regulator [Planctomycetota bacterium]
MATATESLICPPRMKSLIDATLSRLNEDCTSLVGKNVGISKPNFDVITLENFFECNEGQFFLIKSDIEDSYTGSICTLIQIKDGIKIGGSLLGYDDGQIKEKIEKEELDEDCTDGLKEFGNQFTGVLDNVFRKKLPNPVHIILSDCKAINKETAKDIFPDLPSDDYLHLSSLLLIKGFDTGNLNMFVQIDLLEDFFEEQIHEKTTNVLILDNSEKDLKLLKRYLTNTEFKPLITHNQNETFNILHKKKIHLILMDVILPDQCGIDVCKKIKKTPYTKSIPIIMTSSNPTANDVKESMRAGAKNFMVKPFTKATLMQKIAPYRIRKKGASLF